MALMMTSFKFKEVSLFVLCKSNIVLAAVGLILSFSECFITIENSLGTFSNSRASVSSGIVSFLCGISKPTLVNDFLGLVGGDFMLRAESLIKQTDFKGKTVPFETFTRV